MLLIHPPIGRSLARRFYGASNCFLSVYHHNGIFILLKLSTADRADALLI